jgi:predicted nucleic acid-binding protein
MAASAFRAPSLSCRFRQRDQPATLAHHPRYDIVDDVRLVLDTDVVVAAMRSPTGASAAILRAVRRGAPTLLLSVPLALEYEAICSEAEHRLGSGLSEEEVDIFLTAVIAMAEPVMTHFLWRPQLRDAGDEMVLEAAVNGGADALVTFNVRDFGAAPARFGIELLLPREAIARVRSL